MTAPTPPAAPPLTFQLVAAGAVGFLTLGLIQAMYGPAFPLLQQRYGVDVGTVGVIAGAHFLGSAAAPLGAGFLLGRMSLQRVVVASLLVLLLGMLLVASAPSWPLAVTGALVGGVGLGGVNALLNAAYAGLGTRAANLVSAMFGLGSILSPLVVAALGPRQLALPFLVVAGGTLLSLLATRLWGLPPIRTSAPERAASEGRNLGLLFALVLGCYVGLEVGIGAWAAEHLRSLQVREATMLVSGYWGGLTLSRIMTALWGGRLDPVRLVAASAIVTCLCLLLAQLAGLSALAYLLAGVALGPVFPTTLAWASRVVSARVVPFLMVAGSLGGIVMPALVGQLVHRLGAGLIPTSLLGAALLLVVVVELTRRATAQKRA